ncbi:MAG: phosphoribosyltransferase family protein [archaeon]|jgi:hypothetical protein
MPKRRISWKEIEDGSRLLYKNIPNKHYDGIVCIATGGLIFGKLLSDLFNLPLGIVSVSRYKKKGGKVEHTSANTHVHWNKEIGKKKPSILLVDDIIDEGVTMEKVINALEKKFSKIDIAVLFYKKERTKIDFSKYKVYYYKVLGNDWVVFPWEIDK